MFWATSTRERDVTAPVYAYSDSVLAMTDTEADGGGGHAGTGVPAADAAMERLRAVESAPLEDHVEIFDDVHRRLAEGLAELDDEG